MQLLNGNNFQYRVLRTFYKLAPFSVKGNLDGKKIAFKPDYISCLIISNKVLLLEDLLSDLCRQSLSKDRFEVIIVFDLPGQEVLGLVEKYEQCLDIHLCQSVQPGKIVSDLRNLSVSLSQGEFLLFLDDDTRIYENDFLESALGLLKQYQGDVLIPQANSLYGIIKSRYDFLDRFSFTSRCSFYRRNIIEGLGGFLKGLPAYEDIELSVRLMIGNPVIVQAEELNYYHPPLYFDAMRKPLAIGQAIFQMRQQYSFLVWLLLYGNALRFIFYGLFPCPKYRQWFKISLGVLLYPFTGKSYYY